MIAKKFNPGVVIPAGVNTVDMQYRGERSGPLYVYGTYFTDQDAGRCVDAALAAWGVRDRYLVNPGPDGRTPRPTNHGGPCFMLLFADGLWRYASFAGINGPPWFRCELVGYPGPTGEAAHCRMQLEGRRRRLAYKQAEVAETRAEVDRLETRLRELGG